MEFILEFIKENYQTLVCLLMILIDLLIIIFKRPVKVDSIKERIYDALPLYISVAEKLFLCGSDKLAFVLTSVKKRFSLKDGSYDSFITNAIEDILLTPTKKERSCNEKE